MVRKETMAVSREPFHFAWTTALLLVLFTLMAIVTLFPFYAITLASTKPA
jgi:hypothetical protein